MIEIEYLKPTTAWAQYEQTGNVVLKPQAHIIQSNA